MDRFALPRRGEEFVLDSDIVAMLHETDFLDIHEAWDGLIADFGWKAVRALGRQDRYYLLTQLLGRIDALNPWLYARCREVEANPDDFLDLWAREHYKSTIITFAGSIQSILCDPEITIGIFSHTKPIAKKFEAQIRLELEFNEHLKGIYPDILYANPRRESPRWSEEKGIIVRRRSNPREGTVEGHGLVDGQPTSAHFKLRIYDDVVTRESVTTADQVKKTTEAWSLSDNLGAMQEDAEGRVTPARKWHIGTRYSFGDTYAEILRRGAVKARIYPATDDGTVSGNPVFLTEEQWADKRKTQLSSTLASQMLQNPAAGNEAMFRKEWLKFTDIRPKTLNIYIMGDPARSKKKKSDKTAIAVVGVDSARNKYLLDGYHHRMNLRERWEALKNLYVRWTAEPGVQVVRVGWERYGLQNDDEYFLEKMGEKDQPCFEITELAWPDDGEASKFDRIQRLVPDFQNGRFYLTAVVDGETRNQRECRLNGEKYRGLVPVKRYDENRQVYSLNKGFLEQFFDYPFVPNDDLIDAISRLYDMTPLPPTIIDESMLVPETYIDGV